MLSWSTAAGNAEINVAKGASVQVSYDVRVNNGVAALTTLANSVVVEWTGIAGVSAFERNGAGCPTVTAPNDYCAGPASHSVLTDPPRLNFTKTVVSQTPAHPGDVVQYRLQLSNLSDVSAAGISLVDELDALNDPAKFVPGTLALVGTLPAGAVNNTNASGGAKGTGRIDIGNLTLGAAGSGSETVVIEYSVQLVPVIANGTVVLNQARAQFGNVLLALSDDPTVNGQANPDVSGDEDPTRLPIESAPQLVVEKVSTYLGADPNVLMAGDTLRYTITVRNIGTDHAHGVILRDLVPANTAYVAGSTTLNGVAVADGPNGSPLINGITVSSPAETTAGVVRADNPANAAANVATITFNVTVDPNAADGTIVANQAFVMADRPGQRSAFGRSAHAGRQRPDPRRGGQRTVAVCREGGGAAHRQRLAGRDRSARHPALHHPHLQQRPRTRHAVGAARRRAAAHQLGRRLAHLERPACRPAGWRRLAAGRRHQRRHDQSRPDRRWCSSTCRSMPVPPAAR